MILAKVAGEIYSTINHQIYDNRKLLLLDRLTPSGKLTGDYIIAIDTVGAGWGETVLVINEGNSARQVIDDPMAPVRSIVIGIVDHIEIADT